MTKEEALSILPGNPVEWPENPEMPYLLLSKSPGCEQLIIQHFVTGEEFSVPYTEVGRISVFRAGSLVKSRMKETGDEVIGMTTVDIWPERSGSFMFTNSVNMKTRKFLDPTDQVQGYFALPTQEEKRKYCEYLIKIFTSSSSMQKEGKTDEREQDK